MKANNIKDMLKVCHEAGQNAIIWGAPGIGKTSIVEQYAEDEGMRLIYIDAPLVDILDLKGALTVEDGKAEFTPVSMWPDKSEDPVIVLIDELPQAVPAIQNGFSKLLLRNEVGNIKLPEGSFIIATGNRQEDKAATHKMPAHIVNRVMHLHMEVSATDWLDWAVKNGVHKDVISFGNFRPNLLHDFKPEIAHKPYPTFRSWTAVSDLLNRTVPGELLSEAVAGQVGEGAASEFMAFLEISSNLPDVDALLNDPDSYDGGPLGMSALYALSVSLAYKVKKDTLKNYFKLLDELSPEFSVTSVKTLKGVHPELCKNRLFTAWAMKNSDLII